MGVVSMKECIGLLTSLEDRILGKEGDGEGKSAGERMKEFLTAPDDEDEDKP